MDKTAKKTKKAADNLQGFDQVNKLQDNSDSDSGDTDPSGGNANIDLSNDISDALKNYENIWDKAFKSNKNKAVELYKKMKKAILWGLAIIGAVAAIAGIAYAVYRFFGKDYLEDFEDDDFEDEFDDDFFSDEDEVQ